MCNCNTNTDRTKIEIINIAPKELADNINLNMEQTIDEYKNIRIQMTDKIRYVGPPPNFDEFGNLIDSDNSQIIVYFGYSGKIYWDISFYFDEIINDDLYVGDIVTVQGDFESAERNQYGEDVFIHIKNCVIVEIKSEQELKNIMDNALIDFFNFYDNNCIEYTELDENIYELKKFIDFPHSYKRIGRGVFPNLVFYYYLDDFRLSALHHERGNMKGVVEAHTSQFLDVQFSFHLDKNERSILKLHVIAPKEEQTDRIIRNLDYSIPKYVVHSSKGNAEYYEELQN